MKKLISFFLVSACIIFFTPLGSVSADETYNITDFSLVAESYVKDLPQEDQEFLKSATPENPVYIFEWELEASNDGLSTFAAAPHVSGFIYAQHKGLGRIDTQFSGTATNCVMNSVDYRMWHGDGNWHDKSMVLNSSNFVINDSFITDVLYGSITINTTGQVYTTLGPATIIAAPKAVFIGPV